MSVILAAVIVVGAALIFILPSGTNDIATEAQSYVTAAYFTDKVVVKADDYTSIDAYKADVKTAMDACRALGDAALTAKVDFSLIRTVYAADALEGLDTDAGADYTGGYTSGAQDAIDTVTRDMRRDAADALDVLEELDSAVDSLGDIKAAAADARDALASACRSAVVVGSTRVSFGGVTIMGAVHSAFIGVDMVIDGQTMYIGANGAVLLSGSGVGAQVAVIDSQAGSGVMMSTAGMQNALSLGQMLAVRFDDLGEPPNAKTFTETGQFTGFISDEISAGLGFNGDIAAVVSDTDTADTDVPQTGDVSANGVTIHLPDIIGNWALTDAVFSPWQDVDTEDSVNQMQLDITKQQLNTIFGDKTGVTHLIFRTDGTGIYYIDVDGKTAMPFQFWWRVDDAGTIFMASGLASYDFDDWDAYTIAKMQQFQGGDDSFLGEDASVAEYRFYGSDLYGDADMGICLVYEKISDSVDFTANPVDLSGS
jgi:hypothetical protein